MPYVTGSANSMADLLSALQSACTTNGWTLSGNVLHKGGCFVDVVLGAPTNGPANEYLSVLAGNGIDGSNALTDPAPLRGYIGPLRPAVNAAASAFSYPIQYHAHVLADPDEVWLWINYDTDHWQWLAFGRSPAPGNAGTGNWYASMLHNYLGDRCAANEVRSGSAGVVSRGIVNGYTVCSLPFWWIWSSVNRAFPSSFVHGVIDVATGAPRWNSTEHWPNNNTVSIWPTIIPLYGWQPSAWSDDAQLFPIQALQNRGSSKTSIVLEMQHARLTRNTYIEPGAIITLGEDRWKVYPSYRRDAAVAGDVGSAESWQGADHSGTFAIAVRYDGD